MSEPIKPKPGEWRTDPSKEESKRIRNLVKKDWEPTLYGQDDDFFTRGLELFAKYFNPKTDIVYYPGSNTHVGPSETEALKGSRIIYVDKDQDAIKALQKAGYEARVEDASAFNPGEVNILILLNFYEDKPVEFVVPGGYIVCNDWWGAATKLRDNPDFEIVAALIRNQDDEPVLVTENLEDFLREVESDSEWQHRSPWSYKSAKEEVLKYLPSTESVLVGVRQLQDRGKKIAEIKGFNPYGGFLKIPYKKESELIFFKRKIL